VSDEKVHSSAVQRDQGKRSCGRTKSRPVELTVKSRPCRGLRGAAIRSITGKQKIVDTAGRIEKFRSATRKAAPKAA
jgi:hypothetical protein